MAYGIGCLLGRIIILKGVLGRVRLSDPIDQDHGTDDPLQGTAGLMTVFRDPEQQIVYSTKCNV
jgi:hypothetical protein